MAAEFGNSVKPTADISIDNAMKVYNMFMLDHPEVFWLGHEISYSTLGGKIHEFTVKREYSVTEAQGMQAQIDAVVAQVIALIPDNAVDFDAEMIVYKWLSSNISYGFSEFDCYTLYGALVEKNCVCEGYSEAFQYICGKIGIPATSITGTADNGKNVEGHKWNAAKIGGKWYQLDVTWAHLSTNRWVLYFNNSAYISTNHFIADELVSLVPDFSAKEAEYLRYYGLYVDSATGSSSNFSFDKAVTRTVVHFKTTLTDVDYYNCVLLKLAPGISASQLVQELQSKPKAIKDALAAASLGDGYKYDSYNPEVITDDTILFLFYRSK